ncbi:hypothetical protein EVAR_75422_1 [Eumeta japonica]|uniref:Uncharacterized protein n=1 Tax=Eumeta variegata TaxID=151549 RepID=A0A4C1TMH9_EUMVA|nr:hypothetical protein EVAR_75422_1 [Eumeta japonica]
MDAYKPADEEKDRRYSRGTTSRQTIRDAAHGNSQPHCISRILRGNGMSNGGESDQKYDKFSTASVQKFKDFFSNAIRDQSKRIQGLFEKIQSNAKIMLRKLNYVKSDGGASANNMKRVASPPAVETAVSGVTRPLKSGVRNYGGAHYPSTGYGAPNANSNHGAPSYHHHSIGFDPLNIVLSVSLLSFLLQALQGLLSRTRLPTPVVEAKELTQVQNWLKSYEKQYAESKKSNKQLIKTYEQYYDKV